MSLYLDCNASTPLEPEVLDIVLKYMKDEYGNAGSRAHEFGARAKAAVELARDQVGSVVGAEREGVTFTSGATEANNLAILGLASHGERVARRHVVATAIEHKAVLEPLHRLSEMGFDIELVSPTSDGRVLADAILTRVRPDTLLVSVMHANNETGVLQPISEIADGLRREEAFFHVDAAQTFGKELDTLKHGRIDLISASAHKLFGPKGVGALITRRRGFERVPLRALQVGGGQERGLRPGTVPVPLVAGFAKACELAISRCARRNLISKQVRTTALKAFESLEHRQNGSPDHVMPHVLNISFTGLDAEAVLLAWKGCVSASTGSACTSSTFTPSHVLRAMGLPDDQIAGAIRLSWSHLTPVVPWTELADRVRRLL